MKRTTALVMIVGLTLAACADPAEQAASDPTATSWQLESGTLNGEAIPVLDANPITLSFEEENSAGGISACNNYFGGYEISGSSISFSELGQTMMACSPDEVMESEAKYLEALALVDAFSGGDDQLTLTGEGVELVFAATEA